MTAKTVAYFVSPHGFGHAARAAAVMEALGRLGRPIRFEIVTTVPDWFFSQSLSIDHRVHRVASDVGMVQRDAVSEDAEATVAALEAFWESMPQATQELIRRWRDARPDLVISDISPLGLEVARTLGLPSILVENFTWDWIYAAYEEAAPELADFGARYAELAASVDHHVRCEPFCGAGGTGTIDVAPVSREPRSEPREIRRALGIADSDTRPMVLLTMGGFGWGPGAPSPGNDIVLVTLGGVPRRSADGDVIRLPDRSPLYPPDLVAAADAVIGKLGYGTVAECHRAGARLGFVGRSRFPESPVLAAWVGRRLPTVEINLEELADGRWRDKLRTLLDRPRPGERRGDGAGQIARLVTALLGVD